MVCNGTLPEVAAVWLRAGSSQNAGRRRGWCRPMLRAQHGLQPAAAGSGPFGRLTVGLLTRLLHRLGANFDQTSEAIQSTSQTRQNLGAHVVVVGHGGSIPAPPVISRDRLGRRDPGKCEKTHISSV